VEKRIGSWQRAMRGALLQSLLKHRPVLRLGRSFPGITLVSRRSDVLDVLERHQEFSVAPYGVKIRSCIGQSSLLGMEDGPQYRRELAILRRSLRKDDIDRVGGLVAGVAQELIEQSVRYKSTIDLVSELCDPLALRYVEGYFGLADPGHGSLLQWFRMMSYYVFNFYLATGPRIEIPAVRGAQKLIQHVHAQVAGRREQGGQHERGDDVLGRLLAMQSDPETHMDDSSIAVGLTTMISGSLAAPFWLTVNVLDTLLDLPTEQLEGARHAARHDEDSVIREYAVEAARFSPIPGIIWRYCEHDTVVARGSNHETRLAAGTLIGLLIVAANQDPSAVPDPEVFRVGRSAEETLLFGHAQHFCFGDRIGTELITQIVKAVLAQPTLERIPGPVGRKQFGPKGSFPAGMFPAQLGVRVRQA
jgi:cytochrome P450